MAALSGAADWLIKFASRFLFVSQPVEMGRVLGIVYPANATHLIKKAGLSQATGQTNEFLLKFGQMQSAMSVITGV